MTERRRSGLRAVALGLGLAALLGACASTSDQPTPEPRSPLASAPIVPSEEAHAAGPAMDEFTSDPKAGSWPRARLNKAVLTAPGPARLEALSRLRAQSPDTRLAALYVLWLTLRPEDSIQLQPFLGASDARERVLAASALLAMGQGDAIPVLLQLLGDEETLPFGSPPIRVWQQARHALLRFTGQSFGLDAATTAEEAEARRPDWESWWTSNRETFQVTRAPGRFDPASQP